MRYKQNANIVARKIFDSYFLIDITDNYIGDMCSLYAINEIGYFIWELLSELYDLDDIVNRVMVAIVDDVGFNEIRSDIAEYIDTLCSAGFVEEVRV